MAINYFLLVSKQGVSCYEFLRSQALFFKKKKIRYRQTPSRKVVCDPLHQKQGKDRPGRLAAGTQPTAAVV